MASTGRAPDVPEHDPYGHGHSLAAWVAVGLITVGSIVMAVAMMTATLWLFIVGAVLIPIGGLAGKVLGALGFGPVSHTSVR